MRLIETPLHRGTIGILLATSLALVGGWLTPCPAGAQSMEGTGVVATGLLLRQMDGVKRVLMIAAHPDDEDTALLTVLARSAGAETAYLALTRGDGGQNLIGPELWEGLGIVRTGELLAARRLDGGEQFFTRAFDYGFSKSADEALDLWPREELLRDVVWVIRKYRPQVVVSVFSGTPLDGHGQHQAAGIMAREAFAAAGDPARFPDQLSHGVEAWQPLKLYQTSRRRFFSNAPDEDDGSLDVPTGSHDPLLGRSPLQLSRESRSQHRSQDMGTAQPMGPQLTGVVLVESRVEDRGQEIFSGIDTTLVGITQALPAREARETRRHLEAYRASVGRASQGFGLDPEVIAPHLLEALRHLRAARAAAGAAVDREFDLALRHKEEIAMRAVLAATGVRFDLRAADDLIVPGQTVEVQAQLWNGGRHELHAPEPRLGTPEGWVVRETGRSGLSASDALEPGALGTWTFAVSLPADAEPSRLYYLRADRDGALYQWPDEPALWGLPRDPAPVTGFVDFEMTPANDSGNEGSAPVAARIASSMEWRYVGVDPAFGEFEKPVLVVPEVSIQVTPSGVTWPQSRAGSRSISVIVRSEADAGSKGRVAVAAPPGWEVLPAAAEFDLAEAGAERSLTFEVRAQGTMPAGRHVFEVSATTASGVAFREGYRLIDYDHIERAPLYSRADVTVSVVPVAVTEGLRVGYVMGSGDDGPEAIRQMGAEVELLDESRVRDGDFDGFSTIVLGVRAYETRPDLQAASAQLLDFARRGGTVLLQYNRGPLGSLPPYPLDIGRQSPRVADETAAVRILEPDAPALTTPNRIEAADFDGWVQERGLYFASEWDDRYASLLELNDPGEPPRRGSVLVAPVGEGLFVYTALSFFRQWDRQVPGAYRLFANLISLDAAAWSDFTESR